MCENTDTKSVIRALYKLNARIQTDCKLLIAEKNTQGECFARGLADAMLQDKPFSCIEVFLVSPKETFFKQIELRMKGFGKVKKAFYLFTNPLLSIEFLLHKNIELIKNDSIWITEANAYETRTRGPWMGFQLLAYKHLTMSTFQPIVMARRTQNSTQNSER